MQKPDFMNSIRLGSACPYLAILYRDRAILAVDKPAGLLVAPDRWDKSRPNLMGLFRQLSTKPYPWARALQLDYLANAHRLDFDTSGVLLLARSRTALVRLADLFEKRAVRKTYLALVVGGPANDREEIDLPIGPHPTRRGLAVIDRQHGKPAQSVAEVVERFRRYTLVRVMPRTGRLHQVRVHLKAIGCPLVGDVTYGTGDPLLLSQMKRDYRMKPEGERPLIGRMALHAASIEFPHPDTGAPTLIEAPLPKDLRVALKYLRKFQATSDNRPS